MSHFFKVYADKCEGDRILSLLTALLVLVGAHSYAPLQQMWF
ncbi:hypothetical protein [Desmonostoc muscorum]|nr:hypothetical protein [Desmonostoc muscorum]